MARDSVPMRGRLDAVAPTAPLPAGVRARGLVRDDAPALGQLMELAYRGTVDDHGESLADQLREASATIGGRYGPVAWPGSLVAVADERLLSACVVTEDRGRLLVAFVLTRPDHRGRGLATALLTRSAARLRTAGATEWTLAVTRGNPAQALYERLGFAVDESLRSR